MEKKTVATTIFACLIVVFIISIGSTISAFKVSREKVEVESISVVKSEGITITNLKGEEVTCLEVKSSSVGVRPATGEEDNETSIPTTVNDAVGTEGAYASFKITSRGAYEIILKSCTLSHGQENLENVRLGIMEKENDPVCGCDIGRVLAQGDKVDGEETVVVVWLDKTATKTIKGAKINLEIEVRLK